MNYTKNEITVSIKQNDDKVLVEVRDCGDGIDEESLEHIWDRYFTKRTVCRHSRMKAAWTGSDFM